MNFQNRSDIGGKKSKQLLFIFLLVVFLSSHSSWAKNTEKTYGIIEPELLAIGYSGKEILEYDVFWSGGIKIGQLRLQIEKLEDVNNSFTIKALISTEGGVINLIYPVRDTHTTYVHGENKLPYRYEVWQKEGFSYEAHRITEYDQKKGEIRLWKNDQPDGKFKVDGEINNEFSSFFNSRLMDHRVGNHFIVPTFADKKRVEVVVNVVEKKRLEKTVIGTVDTVKVMPVMTFRGLYDKKGDTVIWYTADECRVPVLITSKIAIGSLTAKLAGYQNSACTLYEPAERK